LSVPYHRHGPLPISRRLSPRPAQPAVCWRGAGGGRIVLNGQHIWEQNGKHRKQWTTAWVPNLLNAVNVTRMIVKGALFSLRH
jgi:hypothetical protein